MSRELTRQWDSGRPVHLPQMYRIAKQLHLLGIAKLLDIFTEQLKAALVARQDPLPNEGGRHGGHVAEIIRHDEHPHHRAERVEQSCLDRARARDRVALPWKT